MAIPALVLTGCSDNSTDNQPAESNTCVVTDLTKLEDMEVFPSDNPLNTNISAAPVDTRSDAIMALIGSPSVHPDFGSGSV